MHSFQPNAYGGCVASLLEGARCNELGPGSPDGSRRAALAALTPQSIAGERKLKDRGPAQACISALWLRHDFLDESHHISQDLDTRDGSYWHAIMHRREPDYGNSKYWFRRVGKHRVFGPLNALARSLARQSGAGKATTQLAEQSDWDPFHFVDLCQQAGSGPPELGALCMKIQQAEWELLFDDCFRRAVEA